MKYSPKPVVLLLLLTACGAEVTASDAPELATAALNTDATWTLTERKGNCGPLEGWAGSATDMCEYGVLNVSDTEVLCAGTPQRFLRFQKTATGFSGELRVIDPWNPGCQSTYDVVGIP